MTDAPHVEMIRAKLVAKHGSLTTAAYRISFGTISGAQLLTMLRTTPMHAGYAASIEEDVGMNPNSFVTP